MSRWTNVSSVSFLERVSLLLKTQNPQTSLIKPETVQPKPLQSQTRNPKASLKLSTLASPQNLQAKALTVPNPKP